MYQPNPTDLGKLGFHPALGTGGIWHHKKDGLWLVLIDATAFALSASQYEAGARYRADTLTKHSFYQLLLDAGLKPVKQPQRQAA